MQKQYKSELESLQMQLDQSKSREREVEKDLKEEILSLKKIIADLENRLGM